MRKPPVDPALPGRRLGWFGLVFAQFLVLVLFAALVARLWYLQVPMADHYRELAVANHHQELVVPATRGQILDSSGRTVVSNKTQLLVSADYHELQGMKDGGEKVLSDLSDVLDVPLEELQQRMRLCGPEVQRPCWPGSPYQPVTLAEDVDGPVALQIMERADDFPGITAQAQAVREYPYGEHAGQMLGYLQPVTQEELEAREELRTQFTGIDMVGRDGLEAVYDKELRGTAGLRTLGVNNHGEIMDVISERVPEAGMHLVTHMDMNVQKVAERALAKGMAGARPKYKADSGAAVVLDVTNGGVVLAFDVKPDGSLTNQRVFVMLPSGGGDGLTVDSQGRLYITAGPALHVASPDGKYLGNIPSPVSLITAAFAGPDKKTIYAVTSIRSPEGAQRAEVYGVPEEDLGKFYATRTLLKQEVLPEHVANAVYVLVCGELAHTTGTLIPVDGGIPVAFLR